MSPATYYVGTLLYLFTAGSCYASFTAVVLEFRGDSGKSGSARYSIINSLGNIPVLSMLQADGWGGKHWGGRVRFAGQITLLGGVILCMVSLTEVIFYLNAASSKSVAEAAGSLNLVHATQHLFSLAAAPLVFLPLSVVILRSGVLPRVFGHTGLAIGGLFAVMGGLVIPAVAVCCRLHSVLAGRMVDGGSDHTPVSR